LLNGTTSPTVRRPIYLQLPASKLAMTVNFKNGNFSQSVSCTLEIP